MILEVGLGGRLDTVNLIDADCAVVTGIAIDHVDYLGDDARSDRLREGRHLSRGPSRDLRRSRPAASLVEHAASIGADLWRIGRDFNYAGDRQQWNWAGRGTAPREPAAIRRCAARTSCSTRRAHSPRSPRCANGCRSSQQAVRTGLLTVELPGRFQVLPGQPTVVYDVAHNPQAAAALAHSLDGMGFHPYTFAIFGAMRDKDLDGIVAPMLGRVDRWFVCGLPLPRAATAEELRRVVDDARPRGFADADERRASTRSPDPADAWAAAVEAAGPDDRIVVFGSFHTVAGVMMVRGTRRTGIGRVDRPHPRQAPAGH